MNNVEKYLRLQQQALNIQFEKIRVINQDSVVKGGANEKTIGEFIKENYLSNFVAYNVEIIDIFNSISDEMDVCICNSFQPFKPKPGHPVIAEGVDFVLQVKAIMTSQEIPRITKNCQKLKRLKRNSYKGDVVITKLEDLPYFIERIPYIVFAYSTQLSLDKIIELLTKQYSSISYEEQVDAIFILNKGCILNFREGKGKTWKSKGKSIIGLCGIFANENTLKELMRYIYTFVPKIRRLIHPIEGYFGDKINYRIIGKLDKNIIATRE